MTIVSFIAAEEKAEKKDTRLASCWRDLAEKRGKVWNLIVVGGGKIKQTNERERRLP